MPPPKKAAKKAAKKAPKKGPKHHDHHHGKDLRRAYEHLGRVEILRGSLKSADEIHLLATEAQVRLKAGQTTDGADLLRAAEHLAFAQLAKTGQAAEQVSAQLKEAVTEQFEHLLERADDHWEESGGPLSAVYARARRSAVKAFQAGEYHAALEFSRAAEALAHVEPAGPDLLETGRELLKQPR